MAITINNTARTPCKTMQIFPKYIFRLRRIFPETTSNGRNEAQATAGAIPANNPTNSTIAADTDKNTPSTWIRKGILRPVGLMLSRSGAIHHASRIDKRKQIKTKRRDSPNTRRKTFPRSSPTRRRVAISLARSPVTARLRFT